MGVAVRFWLRILRYFRFRLRVTCLVFCLFVHVGIQQTNKSIENTFLPREWLICVTRGGGAIAQICLCYTKLEFAIVGTLVFAGPFLWPLCRCQCLARRLVLAMVGGAHGIWWGCNNNAMALVFFGVFGFAGNGGTLLYTSSTLLKLFPPDYLSGVIQFRSQFLQLVFINSMDVFWRDKAHCVRLWSWTVWRLGFGWCWGLGLVSAYRMTQPSC